MTKFLTVSALVLMPLSAVAMPTVGDIMGTDPEQATAALEAAGCMAPEFEAEDGKIEAKCHDEANNHWEVYIDPQTGAVAKVKADD
ncbi:PepSY domain-containing protein [Phaeobacter sp. HF9A]|uniref:PepSY domain-containing protein n=1 Tax=Phaeobacter sp. HF9A TaxID=2721561 RepID=UPI0014315CAF|nr:PepSY domain-containing protein [Phaeobacter sp. HF9A]NIZ15378.1 PepSY domain-containing protein [Phaeobacter sp. HF9A]